MLVSIIVNEIPYSYYNILFFLKSKIKQLMLRKQAQESGE